MRCTVATYGGDCLGNPSGYGIRGIYEGQLLTFPGDIYVSGSFTKAKEMAERVASYLNEGVITEGEADRLREEFIDETYPKNRLNADTVAMTG